MLQYVNSSLLTSPAKVLVNTVNTVGAMGKGVALEFKKRYPDMYEQYRDLCLRGEITVGKLWLYRTSSRWILNFPTKENWRRPSKPEYIEAGLRKFVHAYEQLGIDSISFPLLGCGNGRLDFASEVKPLMDKYLRPLPIAIYVHVRVEDETFVAEHEEPDLFTGGAAPLKFADFWRDLRQLAEQHPELELRTLATGAPFRLAYVSVDQLVFERSSGAEVRIPRGDLRALWIRLRLTGTVKSADAPGRIGREYGVLFPFLTLLPYIDRVDLADEWMEIKHHPSAGIQLRFNDTSAGRSAEPSAFAYG